MPGMCSAEMPVVCQLSIFTHPETFHFSGIRRIIDLHLYGSSLTIITAVIQLDRHRNFRTGFRTYRILLDLFFRTGMFSPANINSGIRLFQIGNPVTATASGQAYTVFFPIILQGRSRIRYIPLCHHQQRITHTGTYGRIH